MKIDQLTFTRFLAAILVVFVHIGARQLDAVSVVGSLLRVGNSAVSYFFVLSGFILVVSNVRAGRLPARLQRGAFWRNRVARIYPLYLTALLLTIGLGALTGSFRAGELSVGSVAASALLVQAWWPPYVMQLNYPGWSLSVEALFYGLFPLLFVMLTRQRTRPLLLVTGLCWAGSLALYAKLSQTGLPSGLTLYLPLLHLNTFLTGTTAGIVFVRHQPLLTHYHRLLTAALLLGLVLTFWLVAHRLPLLAYYHDGLFAPLFAVFILWLSTQANPVTRWLSGPFPVWLGEISYGIYLLQVPVGMALFSVNHHRLHWPILVYIPLYIGLLIGTAAFCYRYIEQPARRFIRKWSGPVIVATPADEPFSQRA